MTPATFAQRLREYRARIEQLAPERIEQVLRSAAAEAAPGRVSAVVTRTGTGTRLTLTGPGARAASRAVGRPLARRAVASVREVVR